MKTLILVFGLLVTLLIWNTSAHAETDVNFNKSLLREIRGITRRCITAEQASGTTVYVSNCAVMTADTLTTAHVFVRGEWLTATLVVSADADGGDLHDLIISNEKGIELARKENLLAPTNVLFALAGATDKF